MSEEFKEQRLKKLERFRSAGVEPYGGRFLSSDTAVSCRGSFQAGRAVKVAGRIFTLREHGKSVFADLRDATGRIQLYFRRDRLGDKEGLILSHLDLGDIVGVGGELFHTKTGEVTVQVKELAVLAKALAPLPEKWHGLKDQEIRYRRRYLDLLVNEATRRVFMIRAQAVRAIRHFLDDRGFLEVETPMMQSAVGGAAARPFITHMNSLGIDLYLRIAPELYLKRLLVGGWDKIYELNRNFRNEGLSTRHNPEFTMLDVYQAYRDWRDMMELTRDLILEASRQAAGSLTLPGKEGVIDLERPWKELSFYSALRDFTGVDFRSLSEKEVMKEAVRLEIEPAPDASLVQVLDQVLSRHVQPRLLEPTFITDYPVELTPLAKSRDDDPALAARFELFINGMELANGYSELNDPVLQESRFREQLKRARDRGEVDEDFVSALEHGMPPAGGLGLGIDRLAMVLSGAESIREVILFPQLRPRS